VNVSMLSEGDDLHIQGFVISKLISRGCWVKLGGQPRKHISKTNVKKGYPKHHRGKFEKQLKILKQKGLIYMFPHGDELHVCAVLDDKILDRSLSLCNRWRKAEGLPELDEELREILI